MSSANRPCYSFRVKKKPHKRAAAFVPHPDDARAVRDALDHVERGEVLSPEASAKLVSDLLGEPWPEKKPK